MLLLLVRVLGMLLLLVRVLGMLLLLVRVLGMLLLLVKVLGVVLFNIVCHIKFILEEFIFTNLEFTALENFLCFSNYKYECVYVTCIVIHVYVDY